MLRAPQFPPSDISKIASLCSILMLYPEIAASFAIYQRDVASLAHGSQTSWNSARVSVASRCRVSAGFGPISETPNPTAIRPGGSLFPPRVASLLLSSFLFSFIARDDSEIPSRPPPSLSFSAHLSGVLALFVPLSAISFSLYLARGAPIGGLVF